MQLQALLALLIQVSLADANEYFQDEASVSLLQLNSVPVDRAKVKVNDTIYHLHVPKVAGISFGVDAGLALARHGVKIASQEGCPAFQRGNPRIRGTAILLRNPRAHVLSQWNYCNGELWNAYGDAVRPSYGEPLPPTFNAWVQSWAARLRHGWHGDFTPTAKRVSQTGLERDVRNWRMMAWSVPPFSPEPRILNPADWPVLDGGGTIWHHVKAPFQCYVPVNMQTQRLSCEKPLDYSAPPNVTLAIQNVQAAWFVGLADAYKASLCLLHAKLGGKLPRSCNCRDATRWASVGMKFNNPNLPGRVHVRDVPARVLKLVDEITAADLLLYKAARERFVREIRRAEQVHGVKLLCEEDERKLEV